MWIDSNKNKYGIMLDIGAGNPEENEYSLDRYVKQDIEPYKDIDLVCDIKDLLEFVKPNQCTIVRASHVIEHFGHSEIDNIMSIIHKILEPNGIFHVVVPNILIKARQLLKKENEYQTMIEIYGGQKDSLDFHKMGYTPSILKDVLSRNNFTVSEMTELDSIGWIDCKSKKIL